MELIITPEHIKRSGLPVSCHIDNEKIRRCIDEAENVYVKPRITDILFVDLKKYIGETDKTKYPSEYKILMDGGLFESKDCCGESTTRYFKGLETTLIYYSYSKLLEIANENVTRFGFVEKDETYSNTISFNEKKLSIKEARKTADIYMNDCLYYLEANKEKFPLFKRRGKAKNRYSITVINNNTYTDNGCNRINNKGCFR